MGFVLPELQRGLQLLCGIFMSSVKLLTRIALAGHTRMFLVQIASMVSTWRKLLIPSLVVLLGGTWTLLCLQKLKLMLITQINGGQLPLGTWHLFISVKDCCVLGRT